MQNIVTIYQHHYYDDEDIQRGIIRRYQRHDFTRDILLRDTTYYTNCIYFKNQNSEITEFKLGIDRTVPGFSIEQRCENTLFLNFILRGRGKMDTNSFGAGEFYYTLPMQKHSLFSDPNDPWFSVWIQVSGPYMFTLQKEVEALSHAQKINYNSPDTILRLAECFLYEINPGNDIQKFEMGILNTMLSYLSDSKKQADPFCLLSRQQKAIYKSVEMIHNTLPTVTVSNLAKEFNLDRRYFSQLFHDVMRISPQQYIHDCRMDYVINLLTTTSLSIDEIVDASGYGHRNSMCIAFRKQFGCSPSQYRKFYAENMKNESDNAKK